MSANNNNNSKKSNPLLAGLERSVGKEMMAKIQSCKLLVVGSGGIGCELLKDLALSGFRRIEVIDLDTIDISNLNRQLLFRNQHVGKAKCIVACEVATNMVPTTAEEENNKDEDGLLPPISYEAHHGNVCDTSKFHVEYMKQFDLVLNALDNVEARRRVNRLCLAAQVPLVEAGTTGYLGQVTVIHKPSNLPCYECKTQETQKVYPICTIRSTPSMPVHTIVWSKELYKLLCHSKIEESMLYETGTTGSSSSDDDNSDSNNNNAGEKNGDKAPKPKEKTNGGGNKQDDDEEEEGSGEPSTYMDSVRKVRELLRGDNKDGGDELLSKACVELLQALYQTEIQKQLDMGRYKAAKKTPTQLSMDVIKVGTTTTTTNDSTTGIWSLEECVAEIQNCLKLVSANYDDPDSAVLESFDKDDDLCMRFVTATSNLRSHVFGITPLQSLYTAKGIAGNIIPAIATTNAICAGVQILQAFKILKAKLEIENNNNKKGEESKSTGGTELVLEGIKYISCVRHKTRNGLYLTATTMESPNPNCFVCRNAVIPLILNIKQWTLEEFITKIVKGRLGFESPTLLLQGDFIWEEGDGADSTEFMPNLKKNLANLPCGGIHNGTVLEIDDATQNLTIQVSVTNVEVWDDYPDDIKELEMPFIVGGSPTKPPPPKAAAAAAAAAPASAAAAAKPDDDDDDDDDDIVEVTGDGNKEHDVVMIDDSDDDGDGDKKQGAQKRPAAATTKENGNTATNGQPETKKRKVQ